MLHTRYASMGIASTAKTIKATTSSSTTKSIKAAAVSQNVKDVRAMERSSRPAKKPTSGRKQLRDEIQNELDLADAEPSLELRKKHIREAERLLAFYKLIYKRGDIITRYEIPERLRAM